MGTAFIGWHLRGFNDLCVVRRLCLRRSQWPLLVSTTDEWHFDSFQYTVVITEPRSLNSDLLRIFHRAPSLVPDLRRVCRTDRLHLPVQERFHQTGSCVSWLKRGENACRDLQSCLWFALCFAAFFPPCGSSWLQALWEWVDLFDVASIDCVVDARWKWRLTKSPQREH